MVQSALFRDPAPPSPIGRGIDLRCCSCVELLASLGDHSADLVIADPPWAYREAMGATQAETYYEGLPVAAIAEHLAAAARVAPLMAMWCTWPLLGEWMRHTIETPFPWKTPSTGGAWGKSGPGPEPGHFGTGHYIAGCSEFFLLYVNRGPGWKANQDSGRIDRSVPVRNMHYSPPEAHSRKPAVWMAEWIARWVPPGGLVVDPYAGLASVAEAVILAGEGRRYVGSEISPKRHREGLALLAQVRA